VTDDRVQHERRVGQFMRQAKATDPDRLAAVIARYVVVSERRLRYLREREIPLEPVSWD
jgi:hypothetical protein